LSPGFLQLSTFKINITEVDEIFCYTPFGPTFSMESLLHQDIFLSQMKLPAQKIYLPEMRDAEISNIFISYLIADSEGCTMTFAYFNKISSHRVSTSHHLETLYFIQSPTQRFILFGCLYDTA